MSTAVEIVVGGLVIGVFYALLALGFGVVDAVGGTNLGYGDAMVLAAFVTAAGLNLGVTPALAVAAGLAASVVLALLTERVALRPLFRNPPAALVATVGLALVWRDLSQQVSTSGDVSLAQPLQAAHVVLSGVSIDLATALAAVLLCLATIALVVLPRRTTWGLRIRAVGDDRAGAALSGIAPTATLRPLHVASGLVGAVAALLLVAHLGALNVNLGWQLTLVGFVAATLGGRRGAGVAAAGGLALGLIQTAVVVIVGSVWAGVAVLAALALVLVARPAGFVVTQGARA